jgi:hypothetical protein
VKHQNNLSDNLRDKTYLVGLILITISFIACVISFWLLYYGILIFAIGAIFVVLSKKSTKTKLLTTILPILVYVPVTYIFLLAYNYTTPKTFLIPVDYEGTLRIVYEESCGTKLKKENGRRIFKFPNNGMLILNEEFDGGINHEYYFVDKSGNRIRIEQILNYKDRKIPSVQVGGAGTIGASDDEESITFSDFYLYNKDTLAVDDYRAYQRFDSITIATVKACRGK